MTNQELVDMLVSQKTLITKRIIRAFRAVDRIDFVLPEYHDRAYDDRPLPIDFDATISQPTTVALMLEKLQPRPGNRILEIGTGSGYQAALLAHLAGKRGRVYSIEYVPQLKRFAESNLAKYGFNNIFLFVGDGKAGLADYAPFDRIISSASGDEIPKPWKSQLKVGGRIIAPVGNDLVVLEKISKRKFKEEKHHGFLFVPLK